MSNFIKASSILVMTNILKKNTHSFNLILQTVSVKYIQIYQDFILAKKFINKKGSISIRTNHFNYI